MNQRSDRPLPEILDELLRSAATTVEGQQTLRRYDHTINFDVLDGRPFHVEILGGEAVVEDQGRHRGSSRGLAL